MGGSNSISTRTQLWGLKSGSPLAPNVILTPIGPGSVRTSLRRLSAVRGERARASSGSREAVSVGMTREVDGAAVPEDPPRSGPATVVVGCGVGVRTVAVRRVTESVGRRPDAVTDAGASSRSGPATLPAGVRVGASVPTLAVEVLPSRSGPVTLPAVLGVRTTLVRA